MHGFAFVRDTLIVSVCYIYFQASITDFFISMWVVNTHTLNIRTALAFLTNPTKLGMHVCLIVIVINVNGDDSCILLILINFEIE